ncbi:MAG: nucleotidyltransferase [Pirellula sp.]
MPPNLLLNSLERILNIIADWGVSPVIAGGLAVSYWGHPRSTRDIDLAILVFDLEQFEFRLRAVNLVPAKQRHTSDLGFVRVSQWKMPVHEAFIDIEIDFLISNSEYHKAAIENSKDCDLPGTGSAMRVLQCEDLLLFKAKSGRLIDLADIDVLLELHRDNLNIEYLKLWSVKLGLDPARWTKSQSMGS